MKRLLVACVLAISLGAGVFVAPSANALEGCVAAYPVGALTSGDGTGLSSQQCTYTATREGLILGIGDWEVQIDRPGAEDPIVLTSEDGPYHPLGTIVEGDRVTLRILSMGTTVIVGHPNAFEEWAP